jgi:Sulfatase-modifying factor enzyme 1
MNPAAEERHLGEYRLKKLLDENPISQTWLAEQVSVARLVLVDELRDENFRDSFLANVRAKAAVDHPLIGSVYEAVAEPGVCFYAHELLPGITLAARREASGPFLPARLALILRRISEAHLQHETLHQATAPLDLDDVYLDEHGVIRLTNLAIAGARQTEQSQRDIVHLGEAFVPLVALGESGATRLSTVFAWMRGEGLDAPLTWGQTRDFCMQIEHQLSEPLSLMTPTQGGAQMSRKQPVALIVGITALMLVGIVASAIKLRPPLPPPPPRASLPAAVTIPAGSHPTPDGSQETLPAFRISAHEITIGQYAEFLDTLGMLARDQRDDLYDLASQPKGKATHAPADWATLLAAAKASGTWQNQPVTLDSPVVGVDWWDAAAYAEWKKGHLPTQEEWFAALSTEMKTPATLRPGAFAPVTATTADRTPPGLLGMAGSVCEWTAKPAANPSNPLGEKFWVIIGGSYLKSGSNALSREWVTDRSLRRPDLGFRVVFDTE